MPGDYTRIPPKTRGLPLMQQGRVLVDADWNELVRTDDRVRRVETIDTIGPAVYPAALADSFEITFDTTTSPNTVLLGLGRYWIDGLLAENAGVPTSFDAHLEEMVGSAPIALSKQPFYVAGLPVDFGSTTTGTFLAVLDVWQREVSVYEDPSLVDPAIGFDTSTRLTTAWQVRLLPVAGGVSCATPDAQIPELVQLVALSAGRLTTMAVGVPTSNDPCAVSAQGGYRGIENRLYRVEIHDPGTSLGDATFKWSRDNASVAAIVLGISAKRLTVQRTGRDSYSKLRVGDTIEVTSDERELARKVGDIAHVVAVDDVDGFVDLDVAVGADLATGTHVRARRWDGGPSPVAPGGAGTNVALEDGIEVRFALAGGGTFHVGDFWCFTARASDGSVEELADAPPLGTHHHYARLATIAVTNGAATASDCRIPWPAVAQGTGDDCACTICVTPEEHNGGTHTLQMAIGEAAQLGGRVCLLPGTYVIGQPISIQGVHDVELVGQGHATKLVGKVGILDVSGSTNLRFADFALETADLRTIQLTNVQNVRFERLAITAGDICVRGMSALIEVTIEDCTLTGTHGIRLGEGDGLTFAGWVEVRRNVFEGIQGTGIEIFPRTVLLGQVVIADNVFTTSKLTQRAIAVRALVTLDAVRIRGNEILQAVRGVEVGCTLFEITDNFFRQTPTTESAAAIVVGGDHLGIEQTSLIARNRMTDVACGISFEKLTPVAIVRIEDNSFERIRRSSIQQLKGSQALVVIVNRNTFVDVDAAHPSIIAFTNTASVTIEENHINAAQSAGDYASAEAIRVEGATWSRIARNQIFLDQQVREACTAILVLNGRKNVEVVGNRIAYPDEPLARQWNGIVIQSSLGLVTNGLMVLEDLQLSANVEKIRALAEEMNRNPEAFVEAVREGESKRLPAIFRQFPAVRVESNDVSRRLITKGIHVVGAANAIVTSNRCVASNVVGSAGLVSIQSANHALINGNEIHAALQEVALAWAAVLKLVITSNIVTGTTQPALPPNWAPLNVVN